MAQHKPEDLDAATELPPDSRPSRELKRWWGPQSISNNAREH